MRRPDDWGNVARLREIAANANRKRLITAVGWGCLIVLGGATLFWVLVGEFVRGLLK